jgi:hypothetical protein
MNIVLQSTKVSYAEILLLLFLLHSTEKCAFWDILYEGALHVFV